MKAIFCSCQFRVKGDFSSKEVLQQLFLKSNGKMPVERKVFMMLATCHNKLYSTRTLNNIGTDEVYLTVGHISSWWVDRLQKIHKYCLKCFSGHNGMAGQVVRWCQNDSNSFHLECHCCQEMAMRFTGSCRVEL